MNYLAFGALYGVAVSAMIGLVRYDYRRQGFSFQLIFSLIYLITFFAGVPFSLCLVWQFEHSLPPMSAVVLSCASALGAYLIYYASYRFAPFPQRHNGPEPAVTFANFMAKMTACLLLGVAVLALISFIWLNQGFLLFKLNRYSEIFSAQVQGIPLKRFFYFFLPALLIWFWLKPSRGRWWGFLAVAGLLGLLNYLAVGGTRANFALAFVFFLIIGVLQGYVRRRWLLGAAVMAVGAMFILALWRYRLQLSGSEMWHTFLYLTRDTFSPWENWALILSSPIEQQGLMPIVRDFYVYIPRSVWAERPDIAWNSANYFTKIVLGNQSGLAISPTLLGSLYIMGGMGLIVAGMGLIGLIMRGLDRLFVYGKQCGAGQGAIIQAYCLANLFNLMVLVREGLDAFVSRWLFFSLVFAGCWYLAYKVSQWKKR